MAKACSQCGKRFYGMWGTPEISVADIEMLQAAGEKVESPLCANCFAKYHDKFTSLTAELENAKRCRDKVAQEAMQANINNMLVCTISPYPIEEYEIMGIASAHVALGTGPLNQLASSLSDLFGQQSESYNIKMWEAESACLQKLKRSAADMEANAVVGLNTTYTELTQGHGMLLVCMNGTAIKRKISSNS